jgi:hypothetical protein
MRAVLPRFLFRFATQKRGWIRPPAQLVFDFLLYIRNGIPQMVLRKIVILFDKPVNIIKISLTKRKARS